MHRLGDYEPALISFKESMILFQELGDMLQVAGCLAGLAAVAAVKGKPAASARLFGAVEHATEVLGAVLNASDPMDYAHNLTAARAQLDEAAWEAAWAEGRVMSFEQAIAYALESTNSE